MDYTDDRKFIEVYVCQKVFVIDEVLRKLLQKLNGAVFFASHGITVF